MRSLKNKIKYCLSKLIRNKLIWIEGNPLGIWWKASDVFARPKIKFLFIKPDTWNQDYLCEDLAIFTWMETQWKSKYSDYRFEWLPKIQLKIWPHYFIAITFVAPNDTSNTIYYETMMNYIWKYNKNFNLLREKFSYEIMKDGKWIDGWNDNWVKDEYKGRK